ncbi:hypothetical protein JL722_8451 [Aureococcus anophagefferens]|nr:hypothetical protein JL722_8451 [Aureococcus anophagefferens]
MGQPAPPTRRRALRCVGIAFLAILLTTTIASCLVVVLHFGDDGGALVAEAGRPTARQCLHSVVRLRAATLGVRPGRFAVPLRREGAASSSSGSRAALGETVERGALRGRASGLRGRADVVALVWDPVDRLVAAWTRGGGKVPDLVRRANGTTPAGRRRLARDAGHALDAMSAALVGTADPRDRCFTNIFQSRVAALANGKWLPFLVDRYDESTALLTTAMGWNIGDALPAPPRATPPAGDAVDLRTRPLLEALEPHDALLHASAGMALSAWSAKLKPFGATVAALRSQRRSWLRGCANASRRRPSQAAGRRLRVVRADNAGRPRAWDAPPCEGATVWGAWCSLSGRLPRALAR